MYIGAVLTLTPQLVRATTNITTYPDWDLSPMVYALRAPALGPSASILCDALSMLGATLLLVFASISRHGVRIGWVAPGLACLGIFGVLLHTHLGDRSIGNIRVGASWVAAGLGAIAVFYAARDARLRRLMTAVLLGFVVLLLLRGVQQVFIEHPQNIENFRTNKDRVLAAHGWSPGSPMALGFERRLSQPEASGWFGLSNVYASLAAGFAAALLSLFLGARARSQAAGIGLATLAAAACVLLAGGKGGLMALAIGTGAVAALNYGRKRPPLGALIRGLPLLAMLGALVMIAVRGAVGERIGELSILFRWFYLQAATRIFAAHPLQGVGPDGFQQAFLLAKPPLCPEEVTSPHSIGFDWLSTLGVFGIGWIALLGIAAWRIGRVALLQPSRDAPLIPERAEYRAAIAIPTIATLCVTWLESPFIVAEMATVRILGLIGWCALAFLIIRAWSDRHASIGLAAAATALMAHAQIEVSASFVSSAPLWAMLIALAAAGQDSQSTESDSRPLVRNTSRFTLALAGFSLLIACGFAYPALTRIRTYEANLRAAADLIRVIPTFGERLLALRNAGGVTPFSDARETPEGIAADLSLLLGRKVATTSQDLGLAMQQLEYRQISAAETPLLQAFELDRTDRRPLREISMLFVRQGEIAVARGDRLAAADRIGAALRAMRMEDSPKPKSSDWAWLATMKQKASDLLADRSLVAGAIAARQECAKQDPYNLPNTIALAKLFDRASQPAEAKIWAKRALKLDDDARLDRTVRGLSASDREVLQAIVGRD